MVSHPEYLDHRYALNIGFNLLNKTIFKYFPFPYTVSTVHVVVGLIYCVFVYAIGLKKASFGRVSHAYRCLGRTVFCWLFGIVVQVSRFEWVDTGNATSIVKVSASFSLAGPVRVFKPLTSGVCRGSDARHAVSASNHNMHSVGRKQTELLHVSWDINPHDFDLLFVSL